MVSAEDGKWETSGNTTIEHTRALNTSTTDRTNFLSGGDTYERIMSRQLGHDLKISTSNGFSLKPEGKSLHIGQSLNYRMDALGASRFTRYFAGILTQRCPSLKTDRNDPDWAADLEAYHRALEALGG